MGVTTVFQAIGLDFTAETRGQIAMFGVPSLQSNNPPTWALWLYIQVAFVTCTPARTYHKCDQYKLRVPDVNAGQCFEAKAAFGLRPDDSTPCDVTSGLENDGRAHYPFSR
jgi:hypothetical protein